MSAAKGPPTSTLVVARRDGLAAQNREHRPNFEAWLRGMIAYVAMARPEQGAELRQALDGLPG